MTTKGALIGLAAALLGAVLMANAFVGGIAAAYAGDNTSATLSVIMFLAGLIAVVAALVVAVVRLVRRKVRIISVLTIVVAAVPLATIVWLRISP